MTLPTVTRYVSEKEKALKVYELLRKHGLADESRAIDASNWCIVAEVGDTYEDDHFTIEIVEETE